MPSTVRLTSSPFPSALLILATTAAACHRAPSIAPAPTTKLSSDDEVQVVGSAHQIDSYDDAQAQLRPPPPENLTLRVAKARTADPKTVTVTVEFASGGGATVGYLVAFTDGKTPPVCANGTKYGMVTSVTKKKVPVGQTIEVSVCSVDAKEKRSEPVGAVASTDMTAGPPAPKNFRNHISDVPKTKFFALDTTWEDGGGTTAGYHLAFGAKTVRTPCAQGAALPANVHSWHRQDLPASSTITVTVCAVDAAGNFSPSQFETVTMPESSAPPPPPVKKLSLTQMPGDKSSGKPEFTLVIDYQSGGGSTVGYTIAYSATNTPPECSGGRRYGNVTHLTRPHFVQDQTITVAVCAYDAAGKLSDRSLATHHIPSN